MQWQQHRLFISHCSALRSKPITTNVLTYGTVVERQQHVSTFMSHLRRTCRPRSERRWSSAMLLLARLHRLVTVCRRLSSSVTLHGGPAGGFTRAGQAMTSCRLQSNYNSTVTQHGGPVVLRPVRATPCYEYVELAITINK